ncbi:hypothetical protein EMIHUDRAFT_226529 [Emiliania huxleyi CCMP1516]|uniref:NADP-dependent oxidoreductase domain-containing protein n=2 Tax=Emiliania huxleyi TaxID=2903 RepID=A0A0D3JMJ6_EMIH1|nr:hypothetical protein EMIHUDRAFT_206840 [Emiliania huxleyi CCMP1516]XP_005788674.1 hypothetical protein EMIHUDRAFT_226529 [Emiliania huxleyi CCMP1516]EOD24731.1 hypothetical protein EMIHUDRAFT_206840 [Emiliania huxleyi CCMP1516]EOD36245.1 hypothetical protein EMIHUDRAFT_226529 [Emiliania huxleyi CCMP1516]|eukprot:XP_005777160.1 hypothetical protein EMIHUDRAFT_206840 [Emiliania huxleyi CCMP1516]
MKRTLPGAAAAVPALPLGPSAGQMPQIGFGTWGLQPQEVSTAIRAAVAAGYRSFDCAPVYQNERQVGETLSALIAEGVVTRSELFITSKVPPADACSQHRTERALRQSLHDLRTGYVDLYLIHWPFCVRSPEPGRPRPWPLPLEDQLGYSAEQLREEWRTIEALVATRAVRHAGLANIGERRLAKFLASPDLAVRPAVVELHPYNQMRALRALCASHGIAVTAYSSLGSPARPAKYQVQADAHPLLLADPAITQVATAHGASAAAVALGWAMRRGVALIPKSAHRERIASNLAGTLALAPSLSPGDLAAIDALERGHHYLAAGWRGYAWKRGQSLQELLDDAPPPLPPVGLGAALLLLACCCALVVCKARRHAVSRDAAHEVVRRLSFGGMPPI